MTNLTGGDAIARSVRAANASGRPALAAFVTGGFPVLATFGTLLAAVAEEADVIEIGVPFTDPMADGLTIQRSSRRALENGVTLPWILETVAHTRPSVPVVLMSYLNPLLAMGADTFSTQAAAAGVAGIIIPDLPYEECDAMLYAATEASIALIQLVTPLTPPERLETLCKSSHGFVYAVTTTGTTGGEADSDQKTLSYLSTVRQLSSVPVLAGFGIRHPEQVRKVAPYVDGVIVGSALIEILESGGDPVAFLKTLRNTSEDCVEMDQ